MIKVDLKSGIYVQTHPRAKVTHKFGNVVLMIGRGIMTLTSPAAHDLGFGLIRKTKEAAPGDYVIMSINNAVINLLPKEANRLGAHLVKFSDDANNYQLGVKKCTADNIR